jgi:hypothetical protein
MFKTIFKTRGRNIISGLCLLLATCVHAQQSARLSGAVWDDMLQQFRSAGTGSPAKKQFEQVLDLLVEKESHSLRRWLDEQQRLTAERVKSYKPGYKHSAADMNFFPLWEEMPGPVPSLREAQRTSFARYQNYQDKVTLLKKQLSEMLQQHLKGQRTDKGAMMQDSKDMADRNGVVRQMGGADAVIKMSEAERRQAAQSAAAQIRSNPGLLNGTGNDAMNAMMHRMMTDPNYRNSYNKMTDAQKEAELKKYMGSTVEARNDRALKAGLDEKNSTSNAARVEQLLASTLQKMQEAAASYAEGTGMANDFYNGIYQGIEQWYRRAYAALPESNMHEKIGLSELIRCRESLLYGFHKSEAATRTILWSLVKANTKIALGPFNDFVGSYGWGKAQNASLVGAGYTEPKVAQALSSVYDEMLRMVAEAERTTRMFKGYQDQYDLITK